MTRSSRSSSPSRSRFFYIAYWKDLPPPFQILLTNCSILLCRRHESYRSRETNKKDSKRRSRSREDRDRTDRGRNRSIDRKERPRSRSSNKRDRYRSSSKDRSERRRSRSEGRSEKRRSSSHEHRSRKRDVTEKGGGKNKEVLEDEAALKVAAEIKETAAAEVEVILPYDWWKSSTSFPSFVHRSFDSDFESAGVPPKWRF